MEQQTVLGVSLSLDDVSLVSVLPGLHVTATLYNGNSNSISYTTGCATSPALHLYTVSGGLTYTLSREFSTTATSQQHTCYPDKVLLAPGATGHVNATYSLIGFTNAHISKLAAVQAGHYTANADATFTVITNPESKRYITGPDRNVIDTFPQVHIISTSRPVTLTALTTPSASTITPSTTSQAGPFTPKVLVIDYNTSGTSDDGSSNLTGQLTNAFAVGTQYHGGATSSGTFQIYATHVENNSPPIVTGTDKGDGTGKGDYAAIFQKYDICNLAATAGVNFVWIWGAGSEAGGPFYAGDFFEWVTTGPTFQQTYGSNVPTCPGHTIVTMGLNYSRAVAEALHSHGHYMENVLQWAFGPGDYGSSKRADMYDLFDGQLWRYAGTKGPVNAVTARCGNVHFPPNATQDYEYSNSAVVSSECGTFNPGQPQSEIYSSVNADTWRVIPCDPSQGNMSFDCDQQSYLMWWMQNMPGYGNTLIDCGGQAMPDWWQYILALDTVTTSTINNCGPSQPTNVHVVPGNGQAGVTWAAPTSAGTDPITGYDVTVNDNSSVIATQHLDTSSPLSVTFSGLINGKTYWINVVSDNAQGEGASAYTQVIPIADSTPPVIVPAVVGTGGGNGWYTSDVNVSWNVTDPESGVSSSLGCGPTTINFETSGTTLTCQATNGAGLSMSQSITVKLDKTVPIILGSAASNGVPYVPGTWTNQSVVIHYTCSDGLSGVASCPSDKILTGNGANQTVSGTATDTAGNTNTSTISGIDIDKTASVNPTTTTVKTTLTFSVASGGFKPREAVKLYWDTVNGIPLSAPLAATTGGLLVKMTVPETSFGPHTILAVGSTGTTHDATVLITPSMTLGSVSGVVGATTTVTAHGVGAGETLGLYWDSATGPLVGTAIASSSGLVNTSIRVPVSTGGMHRLYLVGQSTGGSASAAYKVLPSLTITPTSGHKGSPATISGNGYAQSESVKVLWSCATPTCTSKTTLSATPITTGADGSFTLPITIPTTAVSVNFTYSIGGVGSAKTFASAKYKIS